MIDPSLPALNDLSTPALVVDSGHLQNNIAIMASAAKSAGVALRPHAKTHKSVEIAQLQLAAGAIGICCATVPEMEAFHRAGIAGLLLTTPVADPIKLRRLSALANQTSISVVVDHEDQIRGLSSLLGAGAPRMQVLVDIDVGQRRTGVVTPAHAVDLARLIGSQSNMNFGGIQGFAGNVQHIVNASERKHGAAEVRAMLVSYSEALVAAGFGVDIVTGSGTGASTLDAQGPYTELQVGSYVFMDADYGRLERASEADLPYQPSLFVLATVTSVNRVGEFTVDAGVKALAFNGPTPDLIIGAPSGSRYRFAGDEHGIITLPQGARMPALGSRVLILATHCDPTVNLYPHLYACDGEELAKWPIIGRYDP